MNKKTSLLASVVIITVIIGGILFAQSKKGKTPIITAQPVEHSQWKTYSNSEYGFEFQYPDFLIATTTYPNTNAIGKSLADFESDKGNVFVTAKNKKFDSNNIEGLYTKIATEDLQKIRGNNIDTFMYAEGDAGCGAKIIDFASGDKTIMISVAGCENQYDQIFPYAEKIAATVKIIK